MRHLWVSRRLSAHLDGELPPRAMLAVDRHLARCARCAGRWDGLRRARAAVQGALRSAPPPEAWRWLRDQMAAPPRTGPEPSWRRHHAPLSAPAWRRTPAWTIAAAAAMLAAGAASLYLSSGPPPPAPNRDAAAFVTTADLMEQDPVLLSPSIELLLAARRDGGPDAGDDR